MVHRGEIVQKAVNESGYSKTKLAKRLGKSRRHLYNMFENNKLDFDTIRSIGIIIHHNFAEDFPEMLGHVGEPQEAMLPASLAKAIEEMNFWKDKYIKLLEQYNNLLLGGKKPQAQPQEKPKKPKKGSK